MKENLLKELQSMPKEDHLEYVLDYISYLYPDREPAADLIEAGMTVTRHQGRLLYALSTPIGKVMTDDQILMRVHTENSDEIDLVSITANIKRARKIIKPFGLKIVNHWGVGYCLSSNGEFKFPWHKKPALSLAA